MSKVYNVFYSEFLLIHTDVYKLSSFVYTNVVCNENKKSVLFYKMEVLVVVTSVIDMYAP